MAKRRTLSVWAVNELHRHAPDDMAALFAAAKKMKGGDFAAGAEQRAILARLRARAGELLVGAGHASSELQLSRVQQNLLALSAAGTWAPDEPGELTTDRDPPGFDALAGVTIQAPPTPEPPRDREREQQLAKLERAALDARAAVEQRAADVAQLEDALEQAKTALADARAEAADAQTALERAKRRA